MVGIIAGTGTLPVAACQALRAQHKSFSVISLFPQDNAIALRNAAGDAAVVEQAFYRASDILSTLLDLGVTQVLMIGKVNKQLLLNNIKLDWLAIKLLASITYKNDQQILQRIVDEFATHGIAVLRQHEVLPMLMTKPGVITGQVDATLETTINFGMAAAKELSRLDLGQTVVVKDTMVLALEAIEGTDACIRRGIALGGNNVVICKAAQATHNPQFDLPTLGHATLADLHPGQVQAIAWLASHTLIVDYNQFVTRAQELEITLLSM